MKFDIPTELASIIKVIGVGGGGSNAVNHMHQQGIKGVDFVVCNTDRQALDISPVPVKVQLGTSLTEGLGAGSVPDKGREAVQENIDEMRELLGNNTKMVFITAGMGGGTGTGAAPEIARVARDMGILTVGIVTMPFLWEGKKRKMQASGGIEEMRRAVDTLLVINNDKLRDLYGNLSLDNAFEHADNVLTTAARGIAEIITKTGKVNVDFEDVKTVMSGSGVAIMGMAEAEGEDRSLRAAQEALASPLLNDNDIRGAKFVLLNITHGTQPVLMDEITEITDHIQEAAGSSADVIWGYCKDESLGDRVRVTVIATGFTTNPETGEMLNSSTEAKVRMPLDMDRPVLLTQPITNPVSAKEAPVSEAPEVDAFNNEPFIKIVPAQQQEELGFEMEKPRATIPAATRPEEPAPEKVVFNLNDDAPAPLPSPEVEQRSEPQITSAQHQERVDDRLSRMRELNLRLRSPSGLSDLEREPAFKRKQITLNDAPHSTDTNVSRYTLSEETDENGERRVELKRNNPYLHDNVD